MIPRKQGLIVTISSLGGMGYLFDVAYGVGKAGCDKLASDMAVDLLNTGVLSVSLWPGAVRTEAVQEAFLKTDNVSDNSSKNIYKTKSCLISAI